MPASRPPSEVRHSPSELRAHERGLFASTTYLLLHGHRIVEARTLDLSAGGLGVVAPVNLPLHLVCGVRLVVPGIPSGAHTVMARAQVMNIVFSGKENGFAIGLRFTSISRQALAIIEAYLHEKFTYTSYLSRRRRPAATPGPAPRSGQSPAFPPA
jgi:hypothetical protein